MRKVVQRLMVTSAMLLTIPSVPAAVTLVDDTGGGQLEFSYGSSPVTSFLNGYYFIAEAGTTDLPVPFLSNLGMTFNSSTSGSASDRLEITFRVENTSVTEFAAPRFVAWVDPNGTEDFVSDVPAVVGTFPNLSDAPNAFEIQEYPTLQTTITNNIPLANTDGCGGAACDVEFALQANILSLAPGQIWEVVVGLSDNASVLSPDHLTAASSNGTLHFSMASTLVPIPAPIVLLGSALGILGFSRRKSLMRD